jgi:PIN domain nuclease of toxin-antitoxin system
VRLLVDTHALLWYTLDDPQLSDAARALILDSANEILISPASYWEIAIKVSIGKLSLHRPYEEFIDVCLNRYGFVILPVEPRHTARVACLPFPPGHKDPFDRLLAAQALVEAIPIISADAALDPYSVRRLW